jgi:hypothetical protein
MHKNIFGEVYCIDILIRILMKFISPFSEQDCIFYKFLNFKRFLVFERNRKQFSGRHIIGPLFRSEAVGRRLGLAANLALIAWWPNGQRPRRPGGADAARRVGGENRSRRHGLAGARSGGQFLAGMWSETLGEMAGELWG